MMPRFAVETLPDRRERATQSVVRSAGASAVSTGGFVLLDGEEFYRIAHVDRLPPFFISVASDVDLWMFVGSRGGLTCGRVDAERALFPYETVDRLHDGHHHTGPLTLLRIRRADERVVSWEPFADRDDLPSFVERNLYKNTIGNRLVFEEVHHGLALAVRYRWAACDAYGWVRTVTIENLGDTAVDVEVLDGVRNVLPHGVPLALYQQSSSLVDAYKRCDLDVETSLATYSLTSKIVDRAEAAEELRANVIWHEGLPGARVTLDVAAVGAFRRGESIEPRALVTGRRGHYLVHACLEVAPRAGASWHVVADVGCDHARVASLRTEIRSSAALGARIEHELDAASDALLRNVASADGLQLSGHPEASVHHFASVLFNNMRGGVFADGYAVPVADLRDFVRVRNRGVATRQGAWLDALPATISVAELREAASARQDVDLLRLVMEYLPLYFSRRHGDPSRPWNRFRIVVRAADGSRALRYEGNWRDIFQNWEALCSSHPHFLPNVIAKFVNASTVDGFNPYRITRDGIDWEVVDPDDPWSYIGYWGDHQIVYLLRLLEQWERHDPSALSELLGARVFSYANVPYRIAPYEAIVADPHETITYDAELAARIESRVQRLGTDGRLVLDADESSVVHVTLLEKLLVSALSKISNFVPGGGIWMNTQRPEWNDANNALVGNGVSVVTLCHLRRYLVFVKEQVQRVAGEHIEISASVHEWFGAIAGVWATHPDPVGPRPESDARRRTLLDALGRAFSTYRDRVAQHGLGELRPLAHGEIVAFVDATLVHVDAAIAANRREDGLYHAYDLLDLREGRAGLHRLYEMLEGQVAALSSGCVDPVQARRLLEALFASAMHRSDLDTFMLYPERELPSFLERNVVPAPQFERSPYLRKLLESGDRRLILRDAEGVLRLAADLVNEDAVRTVLDAFAAEGGALAPTEQDRAEVLEVFEAVFHHRSFTGRSGTMYGYEGIGCIYWHMVAKLLLAVQEIHQRAVVEERPEALLLDLARSYHRVRAGLGFEKTVEQYGAFPTDPYSHTPRHAGAQQPGMTGQVKEEILTRLGELGVEVRDGVVGFAPRLLRRRELLPRAAVFRGIDVRQQEFAFEAPAGGLAFTYCQVPVVYELSTRGEWLRVSFRDGRSEVRAGHHLTREESRALLARDGEVVRIDVGIREQYVLDF